MRTNAVLWLTANNVIIEVMYTETSSESGNPTRIHAYVFVDGVRVSLMKPYNYKSKQCQRSSSYPTHTHTHNRTNIIIILKVNLLLIRPSYTKIPMLLISFATNNHRSIYVLAAAIHFGPGFLWTRWPGHTHSFDGGLMPTFWLVWARLFVCPRRPATWLPLHSMPCMSTVGLNLPSVFI